MEKQLEIDWTRARQLMVLSACQLTDVQIQEGATQRTVRAITLKAVLQAIDHHGRGRTAWLSFETIAAETCCSVRQAKRAIQALEQESFVAIDRAKCNRYSIVWSELNLRCPNHRQLEEIAAPVPASGPNPTHPTPERGSVSSTRESAQGTFNSAQRTRESAQGALNSAQVGTQTVPEPHQNRTEPPAAAKSGTKGGGGWQEICEAWRSKIGQVATLASEAKAAGETPDAFLARLRSAWEVAVHPLNAGRFRSPAGAVYHWMRRQKWPAEGVIDPGDVGAVQAATQRVERRQQAEAKRDFDHDLFVTTRDGRRAGKSDEQIRAELLRRWPAEVLAGAGW